jgi:hypothetical protein
MNVPYKYNIDSTVQCAEALKMLSIQPTSKMITLDITNLYTNIPSNEAIDLINQKLQETVLGNKNLQDEVIELVKVTIQQNYFESNNMYWQQDSGTPVGSPIASILAEIFLQNLQQKWYPNMINTRNIQYIGRYVDDVLIVYGSALSTAEAILHDHDMHSNILVLYKMETEKNERISFLDLSIYI